jgi:hypothetical protein
MSASACLGSRACGTVPVDLIVVSRVTNAEHHLHHESKKAAQRPYYKDAINAI